ALANCFERGRGENCCTAIYTWLNTTSGSVRAGACILSAAPIYEMGSNRMPSGSAGWNDLDEGRLAVRNSARDSHGAFGMFRPCMKTTLLICLLGTALGVVAVSAQQEKKDEKKPDSSPDYSDPAKLTEKAPELFKAKFETTKGNFTVEVTRSLSPNGADR